MKNEVEKISIQLPELKLAALSFGNKSKPPILALHGWLDNAASFYHLAPLLKDYHVIALDMPGHGHSEHLPKGDHYQFLAAVEVLIKVMDKLGWKKPILMGHSLGGAIASFIAASFPERVEKLIMLDSIGPLSEESVQAPGRLRQSVLSFTKTEKMPRKTYKDIEAMIKLRVKVNHVDAEHIRALVERAVKEVEGGYQWRFDPALTLPSLSYLTEEQVLAFLASIKAPTLVVEAKEGILVENELLSLRKQAIFKLVTQSVIGGHHMHLSNSVTVAKIILDFLAL